LNFYAEILWRLEASQDHNPLNLSSEAVAAAVPEF
jgi:hypothetical protein